MGLKIKHNHSSRTVSFNKDTKTSSQNPLITLSTSNNIHKVTCWRIYFPIGADRNSPKLYLPICITPHTPPRYFLLFTFAPNYSRKCFHYVPDVPRGAVHSSHCRLLWPVQRKQVLRDTNKSSRRRGNIIIIFHRGSV